MILKQTCGVLFIMILKKIRVIDNEIYYRTKIRLDNTRDYTIYGMCYYCNIPIRLCKKDKLECMKTNYILSLISKTYRYFPYAPEKKKYILHNIIYKRMINSKFIKNFCRSCEHLILKLDGSSCDIINCESFDIYIKLGLKNYLYTPK